MLLEVRHRLEHATRTTLKCAQCGVRGVGCGVWGVGVGGWGGVFVLRFVLVFAFVCAFMLCL